MRQPSPALIKKLFERFEQDKPEPKTELDFVNPYTLVVAVALSAQTTDKAVNKATEPLFKIADTPQKMVALGVGIAGAALLVVGAVLFPPDDVRTRISLRVVPTGTGVALVGVF